MDESYPLRAAGALPSATFRPAAVQCRAMRLDVINDAAAAGAEPWYAEGLKFTCTQCGNCCTGPPGYVWISEVEVGRVAEFLNVPVPEVQRRYLRRVHGQVSLKETIGPDGGYDCIFLKHEKVSKPAAGGGGEVVLTRRICSIYGVRPLQCRTWPFWKENLSSRQAWDHAARRCHGMNHGHRHFSREQREVLRDAKDWPENPPTS